MTRRQPAALLVLLPALLAPSCGRGRAAEDRDDRKAVRARIVTVEQRHVRRDVQSVGSLFPFEEVTVSSEVEGKVDRVLVDVGDRVARGQALVAVSPVELELALEQQRAALEQVKARLGPVAAGGGEAEAAEVKRAAADLLDAEQKFDRARSLFDDGLIARGTFDESEARYKAAQAAHDMALQVRIDRQRASDLGVRAADVAGAVRLMIAGEDEISTYKEGDEQYPVTMQVLPEQQRNPEVLARLMIPSAKVGQVRLDNVASIERGLGPARIDRYNRQFQVQVFANNAPDFPLDQAARVVGEEIRKVGLPPGYSYRFSGAVKILDETTRNLMIAFLLASIFMFMVLAAQFDSLVHPFTIMLSLPLSIPFALLTLWLTGRTLNLWSALGVLLLLGIVKKNGILQVDYTNKLLAEGVPLREAILQANRVRLRPILMTTLAIVAGLVPTALGIGAGSAQRSAVAVTIIGGQSLCLLLTLVATPVAYSLLAEARERGLSGTLGAMAGRLLAGRQRA